MQPPRKIFFLEIILSPLTNIFLEIILIPWTNIFPIDGNYTKPDNLFPGIGYFEQCPSASPGGIWTRESERRGNNFSEFNWPNSELYQTLPNLKMLNYWNISLNFLICLTNGKLFIHDKVNCENLVYHWHAC